MNTEGNAAQHPTLYVRSCLHRQDGSRPYPVGRYARRPTTKISGSVAFKAPLCTISNISLGPPVGAPLSVHALLGHIKGRARPLEHGFIQTQGSTSFHTCRDRHSSSPSLHTSSGNTSHSGRRVLRSGGPNHSKSLCASVFLRL